MISLLLLLLTLIIIFFIGLIVLFKDLKNKVNLFFFLMICFIMVWILSNYFENEPISLSYRILFLRIDFASAIILGIFFYLFCLNFPYPKPISLKSQTLIYFSVFLLIILSFTDLIIKNIRIENSTIQADIAPLFFLYAFFLFFYIGSGLKDLVLKYRKMVGIEKNQILYVFSGLFISAFVALVINLILPQIIFIPADMGRVGIYGILIFCIFTSFAITRYHLFGIRVILTETLVAAIGLTLLVQALTAETLGWKIFGFVLFIVFAVMGYLLIKYTYLEIRRRQEIEKIDRAKSEFISIASHQLRTPLTAVKGYISMILEGVYGQLSEKLSRPLENVYQSNERLIRLVNDLLNLSRLDAGKIEFSPELTSLEEMVSGITEELRINAEKKGLYMKTIKPSEPLPKIMVDQDKLRQVVLNIVDNAIKYTKKGGITFELKKLDEQEEIRVSDTGEGMDEKELNSLFQVFSRATAGTQLHAEGAGIGLYVARQFVEMHGGKIWAKSPGKGKGATFIIQLPIKLDPKLLKEKTKTITKAANDIF